MSHKASERMFWFRGGTMVAGGRIESPIRDNIDAQGACVLPPTGGFAAASVGRFDYRNILRFERATSTVSGQIATHGREEAGETLVTVAIEGLNVLDVITADRVVARMTSRHVKDERGRHTDPEILPFGSHFENLRIGGIPVELTPYRELVREGHHDALIESRSACADEDGSFPWIDSNGEDRRADDGSPEEPGSSRPGSRREGARLAPLFDVGRSRAAALAGSERHGAHGIRIPGFGVAYFGEYLVTRASRRLTMLRIELGCPISGRIVCANVDSNGHWDP
jgi:hypothetical protein